MTLTTLATIVLCALASGGVAYALLYPALTGGARAEKRQKALVGTRADARVDRSLQINRRDQVAQSLKDLEKREKDRNKVTLESRIAQAGLTWTTSRFWLISAGIGAATALVLFVMTGETLGALGGFFIGALGLPNGS